VSWSSESTEPSVPIHPGKKEKVLRPGNLSSHAALIGDNTGARILLGIPTLQRISLRLSKPYEIYSMLTAFFLDLEYRLS
jgi:hypothetical protein